MQLGPVLERVTRSSFFASIGVDSWLNSALDVRRRTLNVFCVQLFEMTVLVLPADIDGQNHVNNTVYLRWVQDVATAHWRALASATAQESIGWVVLRHEIDYKTAGNLGDEILLRTWVGKATRLTFERFTDIRRKGDDQLLARARTVWCPINSQTGRPTRVSADVRAQFSV